MSTKVRMPLELRPNGVGPPRLDTDSRILARFYEPLYLLRALGQTRDTHTRQPRNTDVVTVIRRKFLENLCFVCDFTKGGGSCTAIGLEDCPDKYRFWVSSNGYNAKIVEFLKDALQFLHRTSHLTGMEEHLAAESEFTQFCSAFAESRIQGERKLVQAQARICVSKLQNRKTKPEELIQSLQLIVDQNDLTQLCDFSYKHRRSRWMLKLKLLALEEERNTNLQARSPFYLVRHYIGRLSHHVRAPKQLVKDSSHMQHVLQTYTVASVSPLAGVQPPLRDRHTNLKGILNRMFTVDNAMEREKVEEGLIHLNRISGIFDDFLKCFEQPGVTVHAEIQVLEHFYQSQLVFADNDCFIACSKPACLCCELYFKHHPARMVIPSSHKKVWPRWSPPNVQGLAAKGGMALQQKRIISKITHDLREQVIDQVLQRSAQSPWHPDSRSCITGSQATNPRDVWPEPDDSERSETDSSSDTVTHMCSDSEDGGVSILA